MQEQYEHGAVEGLGGVDGKAFDALEGLGLLYHYQLAFGHHGETPGRGDYLLHANVGPVADGFVEVFFVVLEAVVDYGPAHQLRVV